MRRLVTFALTVASLLAVAWFGGCQDPVTIEGSNYPAGRIQGRVYSGGVPIDATIRAYQIEDGRVANDRFETDVHPGGLYTLDLPAGRFVLRLIMDRSSMYYHYSATGPVYGQADPDTIEVVGTGSIQQANFRLGGLDFQMDVGAHLEDRICGVAFHRRGEDQLEFNPSYVKEGKAEIENGHLDLKVACILPGEYRLQIVLDSGYGGIYENKADRFWYPGTRDTLQSPWITIGEDSLTSLACELVNEPAYLEGRVSGAWLEMGLDGRPDIALFSPDSTLLISEKPAGYDGKFQIVSHLPVNGKIRVEYQRIEQWVGGPTFDEATVFSLVPGDTITGVELVQCGLHLVRPAGMPAMGSASLKIYDESGEQLLLDHRLSNDEDPHIAVTNLWAGRFRIHLAPSYGLRGSAWWVEQWYDRKPDALSSDLVLIDQPGDIALLELNPVRGGVIRGEVLLDEVPFLYYIVVSEADEPVVWGQRDYWYAEGSYQILGLPDGSYKLGYRPVIPSSKDAAELPENVTWFPGTADWDSAQVLVIQDAAEIEGIDFDLRP